MTDWERLKELVKKLKALGEDEGLDAEDYVDLSMEIAKEAVELVDRMIESPQGA